MQTVETRYVDDLITDSLDGGGSVETEVVSHQLRFDSMVRSLTSRSFDVSVVDGGVEFRGEMKWRGAPWKWCVRLIKGWEG